MNALLIDTDTASDDAVALIMALRNAAVRVVAIATVCGNVPLEQATTNALYTLELCGADVPVYRGAGRPLIRPARHAQWFHGQDGLGDNNYPPPKQRPAEGSAVDAIIGCAREYADLTLVTLGPLTNIAIALLAAPAIAGRIRRCVIMGGNPCCEGNVTPAAEYNIWCDPEAARIVLHSGLNIELVGWQLCRGEANLNADDIAAIRAVNTPLAHFVIDASRTAMAANRIQSGEIGIPLPDPTAMAIAIEPRVSLSASRHHVDVECAGELTAGMTVVDRLGVASDDRNRAAWGTLASRPPNALVHWKLDVAAFKRMVLDSVRVAAH